MGILQIASCASKPLGAANRHYPWGIHRQPQRQQGASSCSFEMLWDDIGMRCVCSQSRQPASLRSVQPSFLGISTFRKLINDDTKTQEDLQYLKITEGIFPPVSWTCHFFSTEEKKKSQSGYLRPRIGIVSEPTGSYLFQLGNNCSDQSGI